MTPASVKEVIRIIDRIAPFGLAESWDNSGLQAGHPDWGVKRILVALDVTMASMKAARESHSDMLITHHPLVMSPQRCIDFSRMPGSIIEAAGRDRIAVVAAHTNLDKARHGLNDCFAQALGFRTDGVFFTGEGEKEAQGEAAGLGRMVELDQAVSLRDLVRDIKQRLKVGSVRVIGDMDLKVQTLALCTGSGGSLTEHFLGSSAGVYVTGDLKYHEARDIEAAGKAAIDVGHFASEHIAVALLKKRLDRECVALGYSVEINTYNEEKDPFRIV